MFYNLSMLMPILATKLYIPPHRPNIVLRPRLLERLEDALHRRLTIVCAPAGFGKTTLVSEWVAGCGRPVAWLSLDNTDNDPARFLTYLIAALQTTATNIGEKALGMVQSPQLPPIESLLTDLLNEIATIPQSFILVLDDYHLIDSKPIDQILTFLVENLPAQMHLVIATREDPPLPLARLRARNQLTEVRATDLRFTSAEAAEFLNQAMGLSLSPEDIASLEARTEGWIAGLQLAALSMQGQQDVYHFVESFSGAHHFVLDYLLEEVLQQQPKTIQNFLLQTSILNRLCGPLCDALQQNQAVSGQETLEYLERANLFIISLDNERHWYRYHHLFGDLLRQRLGQIQPYAGNTSILDVEMFYTAQSAYQRLSALGEQGRATYLRILMGDLVYPALLGFFLSVTITLAFRHGSPGNSAWQRLNLLPLANMTADYLENMLLITLLTKYPTQLSGVATISGFVTLVKNLFGLLSFLAVGAGLMALLYQRVSHWRSNREHPSTPS